MRDVCNWCRSTNTTHQRLARRPERGRYCRCLNPECECPFKLNVTFDPRFR